MTIETGVVTSKGQIVIPASIRRRMRIRKGTRVAFRENGPELVLQPLTDDFIRSLRGALKPRHGEGSAMDLLLADRRSER